MAAIDPLIVSGNTGIAGADLNDTELEIFEQDFARLARMYALTGDLSKILTDDHDQYLLAAQMAKGSVGSNPTFTGVNAKGTELGFQIIRATTVLGTSSGNVYNWVQKYSVNGWTNVFGSSASPIALSSTGAGGSSATNLAGSVLLAFGCLINPVAYPQLSEYRFHVGAVDYEVESIAWQPASDLYYASLFGFCVIPVNGSFYMRGNVQPSTTGGQDNTQLGGLTFATGNYLSIE